MIHGQELIDYVAGFDQLDGRIWHLGVGKSLGDDGGDGMKGFCRLFAAFQNGGIARFDGERRDIGDYLWPGFEDDEQHTDGTGYSSKLEAVVELGAEGDFANCNRGQRYRRL